MPFSVVSKETCGSFSALRSLKLDVPVEHELLPPPNQMTFLRSTAPLGRLPRLQHLCLKLDASPSPFISVVEPDGSVRQDTAVEPWFDAWDAEYVRHALNPHRRGHIRDVFVNSAIDSAPARSIFKVVDSAKRDIKGRGPVLPLESLTASAFGGSEFAELRRAMIPPAHKLRHFLTALDRKWLVEREVRDDARDVLHVRELDREWREERMAKMLQRIAVYTNEPSEGLLEIWKRTWSNGEQEGGGETSPVRRRSARIAARSAGVVAGPAPEPRQAPVEEAWWDNWKSWPLALES